MKKIFPPQTKLDSNTGVLTFNDNRNLKTKAKERKDFLERMERIIKEENP